MGGALPPIPQEFPPLPLPDSRGRESQPQQGEALGVREASALFRNLLEQSHLGILMLRRIHAQLRHEVLSVQGAVFGQAPKVTELDQSGPAVQPRPHTWIPSESFRDQRRASPWEDEAVQGMGVI